MYLSRIALTVSSPDVRQCLRNCQDMHRTIMKAYDCTREEAQVLYRVLASDQKMIVYVQSEKEPQWEKLESRGFCCEEKRDITSLFDAFINDRVFRFSLLACPTKKVRNEGKNSRRELLRSQEERIAWLKKQGEKNGFAILEAYESGKNTIESCNRENNHFFVSGVPFEGILRITDQEAFQKAFLRGIGPEKSYGFGMLMIGRV